MTNLIPGSDYLSLDLTHRCNLACHNCGKRIPERNSDAADFTLAQARNLGAVFSKTHPRLRISGGEPLCHPGFELLITELAFYFPLLIVATNGLLLPKVSPRVRVLFHACVSRYAGVNDHIFRTEFARNASEAMWLPTYDPFYNPGLEDYEAQRAYADCKFVQLKVIGDNLYGCCHAETAERFYDCPSVHVSVSHNWKEDLAKVNTWTACKHCFVARPRIIEEPICTHPHQATLTLEHGL